MRSPVVWIVVAIIVALMAIGVLTAVVTIVGGLVYAPVTAVTAGIDREPSPRPVTSVVVGPAQQDAERVDYATLIGREKATAGIVVTGEGIVKARPDRATVTVGAQTRAETAREAQTANNALMVDVLAAIKAQGISENDIQTTGLQLSPVYDRENEITGYSALNTVTVNVRDVDRAGSVLDAAVAAGANTGGNIGFGLEDDSALVGEALRVATEDARSKADAIAGALGVEIRSVDSIVEESVGLRLQADVARPMTAELMPEMPIEPGEISVTARLRITYSY